MARQPARATASPAAAHGAVECSNNVARTPQTAAPHVIESGSRNVLASMSAPAIISVPSTVDAMATGQGNVKAENTPIAAAPPSRIVGLGRRSSTDAGASLA